MTVLKGLPAVIFIAGVCLVLLISGGVNLYQAANGINLPGSAYIAALESLMLGITVGMFIMSNR